MSQEGNPSKEREFKDSIWGSRFHFLRPLLSIPVMMTFIKNSRFYPKEFNCVKKKLKAFPIRRKHSEQAAVEIPRVPQKFINSSNDL